MQCECEKTKCGHIGKCNREATHKALAYFGYKRLETARCLACMKVFIDNKHKPFYPVTPSKGRWLAGFTRYDKPEPLDRYGGTANAADLESAG